MASTASSRCRFMQHFAATGVAATLAPGIEVDKTRRPVKFSARHAPKRPANLEDVAFWPVRDLAELIRTRKVTSLELTEMYIARLHRHSDKLNNVVTFLDDVGRAQARQADAEIAGGKYKGPLHGMPSGAKDTRGRVHSAAARPHDDDDRTGRPHEGARCLSRRLGKFGRRSWSGRGRRCTRWGGCGRCRWCRGSGCWWCYWCRGCCRCGACGAGWRERRGESGAAAFHDGEPRLLSGDQCAERLRRVRTAD